MKYESEEVKTGDRGLGRKDNTHRYKHLLKGYHTAGDTYLHAIHKYLWATNDYTQNYLFTKEKMCIKEAS